MRITTGTADDGAGAIMGDNPDAWMDMMFSTLKPEWKAKGAWFVQAPQGVQDCAVHTGSDYSDLAAYVNRDNTDGNGNPIP